MTEHELTVWPTKAAGVARVMTRSGRRPSRGATLEELAAVYVETAPQLRRVAAGILADADAAQDVVQEAFARAIRKRATFARVGSLEGWLWRVVVNTALNRRRADAAEAVSRRRLGMPPNEGPTSSADGRIRSLVAELPDRQRVVLFLHYYADLDYATIGRILRIRSGTVGKLLHDARAAIRAEVER